MTNIQKKAAGMLKWFENKKRDNGETFYSLKDGHPEELKEMVYKAHAGMLPDDHKYEYVVDALERVLNYDSMDDIEAEIEADVYNHDLLKWLSSNLERAGYVEDYVKEFGIDAKEFDLYKAIGGGQYLERCEVFNVVRHWIEGE